MRFGLWSLIASLISQIFYSSFLEIAAIERGSRTRNVAIDPAKPECLNGEPAPGKVGVKPGGIRGKYE